MSLLKDAQHKQKKLYDTSYADTNQPNSVGSSDLDKVICETRRRNDKKKGHLLLVNISDNW